MSKQIKVYKTGLVIGKFYPPHRGHKYLIDSAQSKVQHLTVIVCGKKDDLIPASLRVSWLKEIHPRAEILEIDDIYDPDDSKIWAENTVKWLGYVPDAVITSEDYGEKYAKHLGCKHILVDKHRERFPVSGTAVRKNPYANWPYLEPCVRAYFAKKVVIVGAESTGTTTLAQALAKKYQTAWVPEYGRTYCEGKMHSVNWNDWQTAEFCHIASSQNRMEEKLAKVANKLLICDTDSFATCLWHERYMNFWSPEVEKIAGAAQHEYYLLTDIDIPFVQDGTRDGEHIRSKMHQRFIEELNKRGKSYIVLSGNRQHRLKKASKFIERIFHD